MTKFRTLARTDGIEEGLAARIHDPLWLLGRQWQFGEFQHEDATSAAWVDATFDIHPLNTWRPASEEGALPYDRKAEPLERLIEQEPAVGPDPRLRLEGGLRLRRMLGAAGLADLVPVFTANCAFPSPELPAVAPPAERPVDVLRGRVPDGLKLSGTLGRLADPATRAAEAAQLGLADSVLDAVAVIAAEWAAWWQARVPATSETAEGHPRAWDPNRQEYAFHLGASTLPEVRLQGFGYSGGRLDWWAMDAVHEGDPDGPDGPVEHAVRSVPSPARFGGMPMPRFWQMEDAQFDPGAIDASPNDLGRLLLTEFATVYGNDWLVLPVSLPVGSLSRVRRFAVTDVFGARRELRPANADVDGWCLFALTDSAEPPEPGTERPTSPWFYFAPVMPEGLESPPLETVLLVRDEMANLAWAVETRVTDDTGSPVDHPAALPDGSAAAPGTLPRYLVETSVPRNWYPLAPEKENEAGDSIVFHLVPLIRGDEVEPGPGELPLGRLFHDGHATRLWLFEEEIPRSGATLTRTRQHARWHDGSVHSWTARAKRHGSPDMSSGLVFDGLTG
ncbi:hypothetical protein GCM10022221_80950 [Actinocorallia aurea]